jgi:hypothetical protein
MAIYSCIFCPFYSVLLHVDIFHNTLQKVSSHAVSVHKAIQYFKAAINDIRENLPQVNGNSKPSTKLAQNDHNIHAEVIKVCDIIVTQMKHCFEEESHTLPFAATEPQLSMAQNVFLENSRVVL